MVPYLGYFCVLFIVLCYMCLHVMLFLLWATRPLTLLLLLLHLQSIYTCIVRAMISSSGRYDTFTVVTEMFWRLRCGAERYGGNLMLLLKSLLTTYAVCTQRQFTRNVDKFLPGLRGYCIQHDSESVRLK